MAMDSVRSSTHMVISHPSNTGPCLQVLDGNRSLVGMVQLTNNPRAGILFYLCASWVYNAHFRQETSEKTFH